MVSSKTSYKVAGGKFRTTFEAKIGVSLPELSQTNVVRHRFAVDDSEGDGIGYDMIIGQDLCKTLGMDVCYRDCTLQMNRMTVAMKNNDFPIRKGMFLSEEKTYVYYG